LARKILLADDSVTAQNMGRKILADAGYEVITVNNGSAALKKIADARPDLIVLDVYMPGYSGLEVCQRLKESGDTARIPILLTVGKLEPFKPEEAKRVRAEGFIVKPFEASELLSALAKLEDKIVPRADASKPGRFARAIAAVEEGRHDNTVAIDEDSGWKNRIAFPSKKKAKAQEPDDSNDSAIYNPVNKDLKTVVERPATSPAEQRKTEERVDLAALAPEGLPKDVTAEEIAALAAAAAQVKGIIENSSGSEPSHSATAPESKSELPTKTEEPVAYAASEPVKAESGDAPSQPDERIETTHPVHIEQPAAQSEPEAAAIAEPATFATQQSQPEGESRALALESELQKNAEPQSPAPEASASESLSSGPLQPVEADPVTIANSAAPSERGSRWTAVATALAPEEVGLVLEDEMRKVYAAFVGADSHSESAAPSSSSHAPASVAAAESASAEPVAQVAPSVPPTESSPIVETEHSADPVSAPEPTIAKVKAFETVAVTSLPQIAAEPLPVESAAAQSPAIAVAEENALAPQYAPDPEVQQAIAASELSSQEPVAASVPGPESTYVAPADVPSPRDELEQAMAVSTQQTEPAPAPEELKAPESAAPEVSSEASSATVVAETVPVAAESPRGNSEVTKKESEIAATTAAAWASWRRIRESGDSKSGHEDQAPQRDEAAMAVAAGAERAPEEVSDSEGEAPEIANIVDSVLADLRPKIVEEISRKLGKKNKK